VRANYKFGLFFIFFAVCRRSHVFFLDVLRTTTKMVKADICRQQKRKTRKFYIVLCTLAARSYFIYLLCSYVQRHYHLIMRRMFIGIVCTQVGTWRIRPYYYYCARVWQSCKYYNKNAYTEYLCRYLHIIYFYLIH